MSSPSIERARSTTITNMTSNNPKREGGVRQVRSVMDEQKNALQVNCVDQKEAPSSRIYKTPPERENQRELALTKPIGALKAAAIPAAAPYVTKSREDEF